MFVYKLFDKRNVFPIFIIRTPYIDSNIPKSIFYFAFVCEFLRKTRSSLLYKDFDEKAIELGGGEHNPSDVERIIQNYSKA